MSVHFMPALPMSLASQQPTAPSPTRPMRMFIACLAYTNRTGQPIMNTTVSFSLQKFGLVCLLVMGQSVALAWTLEGQKTITAHSRDQQRTAIGHVNFVPQADGSAAFKVTMDHAKFTDYFLSMKEFKCLSSPMEVTCHVPYPYAQPGKITREDLTWLEHNLLFLYKTPAEFGAKLWNGIYFKLQATELGLRGTPMAIDLNLISAPPEDLSKPTYGPDARDPITVGARWIEAITIE